MPRQELTKQGRRRLKAAQARVDRAAQDLDAAELAWAKLVRELGQAAVARELGLSAQAVSARLRVIERRSAR